MFFCFLLPRLDVHYVGQRPSNAPGYPPFLHRGRKAPLASRSFLFHGRSDGSVTLRDVRHDGPVLLNWRQPNNQACMVAEAGELVLPDETLGATRAYVECTSEEWAFQIVRFSLP